MTKTTDDINMKSAGNSPIDLNHRESRQKLVTMIIRLFDHWELTTSDQLELLGLGPNSQNQLARYRKGISAPSSPDKIDRIGYLLNIHKHLRTLYPENQDLCYQWVHMQNKLLDNVSPLDIIKRERIIGLYKISMFLESIINK